MYKHYNYTHFMHKNFVSKLISKISTREHLYIFTSIYLYKRPTPHLLTLLSFLYRHTLNFDYNTNLFAPLFNFWTQKKNTPVRVCSLFMGSYYSIPLLSHSSLKSVRPSIISYKASSGKYTVLPFK